ncbi:MAG: Phospho-2-dehydro-3-deoxyheptonate aldolase, Tyr-sensitive [Chlamydiia bacterium]|nr:Phospho-2-dehydro-3-deoxyheptonate aldolase, Tyr-sensitive [Chlamydiia bacterium]
MKFHSFPPPNFYRQQYPLPPSITSQIARQRREIAELINRKDPRLLLILGPCSIHHAESAIEYAHAIKALQEEVKETLYIIMRAYIEKPRTTVGWKGYLYDPLVTGSEDLNAGIAHSRKLLCAIQELNVPIGCEFVDPNHALYFEDLVSWGCIGARTATSQTHRQIASFLNMPIGIKNSIDGNIKLPIEAMVATASPHHFLMPGLDGHTALCQSDGNPLTHLILRGSNRSTNYDIESISHAINIQKQYGIHTPVMIDCGHGNSRKDPYLQVEVFKEMIETISDFPESILGLMMESFIEPGKQSIGHNQTALSPTKSITDPCVGLEETQQLTRQLAKALSRSKAYLS